jgi:hypothetical protein
MISYVPRLEISSQKDYVNLKGCIQDLDNELVELDFEAVLAYLEYEYEDRADKEKIE